MRFRRDRHAPLLQIGPRRLPSLDQPAGNRPIVGGDTQAFRAVLYGATFDQDAEIEEKVTKPLPRDRLANRKTASKRRRRRLLSPRRLMVLAAAILVLLGVAAVLPGTPAALLAFGLGTNQHAAPALSRQPSAPHSGIVDVATPTNTPTQTPLPPTATSTPRPPTATPRPQPTPLPPPPPGPYSNWTPPPGYHSFAVQDFPNDPWAGSFGQCTWWVHYKRPDENLAGMGDAWNWANAARARGLTVTTSPAPNATVVFAPGVQGASNLGHVSHVEKVLTGGWVLVSEMNFYWNGGGFARVDYRYIHMGTGVWFIH